jgi:hypothetical protein
MTDSIKLIINDIEYIYDNGTLTLASGSGASVGASVGANAEIDIDIICKKLLIKYKKNKLNLGKYTKITNDDTTNTCPVCLEQFKEGFYKRTLRCSHTFHKKCIDKWLNKNCVCPICRQHP